MNYSQTAKTTTLLLILVLVILIAASYWLIRWQATTPQTPPTKNVPASVSTSAITLHDQPAGPTVRIANVTLAQNGWVVIHESKEGKPGAIIAAARLNAGTYENREVDLLGKQTEVEKNYFAMLHSDDGDRQFDHTKDLPIKDSLGNVVTMKFRALTSGDEQSTNWKTYRNEKYGFEVRYPTGSKIVEATSEWGLNPGGFHVDLPFISGTGVSAKYLDIAINIVEPTVKECFSVSELTAKQVETVRLGGVEFKKLMGSGHEYAGGDLYQTASYSTHRGNECFNFSFVLRSNGSPDMERESAIFSSLLSTFKFTK